MKFTCLLLFGVFLSFSYQLFGSEIDYAYYNEKYANEHSIVLNKEIRVSFSIDKATGELSAKATFSIERLYLTVDTGDDYITQIPYNSFQDLQLTNARLFAIDSEGELQLKENIKVKYAESKDYFIEGIFYNDLKVKQFVPTIRVRNKNILKYSYEYSYTDLKFLNALYVTDNNEAVENFQLIINYPSGIDVAINQFHIPEAKLDFKEIKGNQSTELIYTLSDITLPARNRLSPSASYYLPHFVVQTKSYTHDGVKKKILESTDDLYQWYHHLVSQLNTNEVLVGNLSNSIIAGKNTDEEKIAAIYKWCQDNIQYVAFEDGIAGFKPEEAQNVLSSRYGDCKGMSNLLVEMLRGAGYHANRAWIGTRHLPYNYSLPSIVVDNHMICVLDFRNQTYFLDPTDKITKWDIPSIHIQGKQIMVENADQYRILEVPVLESSMNRTIIEFEGEIANDQLLVEGKLTLSGMPDSMFKSFFRNSDFNTKKRAREILLAYHLQNFVPKSDVNAGAPDFSEGNIQVKIDGYFAGCFLKNEQEIYMFPSFDDKFSHVEHEKFETPLAFDYNEEFRLVAKIKLPPDSRAVIPANYDFTNPQKTLVGKITYTVEGNVLIIRKDLVINTLLLDGLGVAYWDEFTQGLLQSSKTPVILKIN